ncbi:HD domain-containing protein [Vibrio parahaemolyticus]|uniref:HD domain-containing protein n=1 Tax=Vibrio parahaemolyticus TaxID=670 RepID=UPI0001564B44|nr:HD domain-containing protein [Vibrio parahaemolyticus]EFO44524.1 metal dependent phosphohydrolase [Vibrio parahaemolyticus AQ4037]EDM60294.1 metal-dependent phosphohydrolase [Vibrio parahaemolyticus AQ3810]EGQ8306891.1 HD domain-containing protein [Vibrio parahaemolyticus]EGQ9243906.1 HD domain-containing protein [Vibrio parahaemolyticus]EGR1592875.1 HD domain-containing protein [Vibrio parahaemolyticus]
MTSLSQLEPLFLEFMQQEMQVDAAHDIEHVKRVVKTAKQLCDEENADIAIVLPAAYLHDCFTYPKDHPNRKQSSAIAAKKAIAYLESIQYPQHYHDAIAHAIEAHSFSANIRPNTLEAQIVQDADRLDALGAIGVTRCIQVSTHFNAQLYNDNDMFAKERELNDKQFTVDHFQTKLFKIVDTMNTESAKLEANKRKAFMQTYLKQLYDEVTA